MNLYTSIFLAFSILVIFLISRKVKVRMGCFGWLWLSLAVLAINTITFVSLQFFYDSSKELHKLLTSGENHIGKVISYTTEGEIHQAIIEFTDNNGEILQKSIQLSTPTISNGDLYWIHYQSNINHISTPAYSLGLKLVGSFMFVMIFASVFVGMVLYAFDIPMTFYKKLVGIIGWGFFVPFVMIGFDGALIYALFYGDAPWFVNIVLSFFILIMTLATFLYIRWIITEGIPQFKQVGVNRWISK